MSFDSTKPSHRKRKLDQSSATAGSQNGTRDYAAYPRYPYAYPYAHLPRPDPTSSAAAASASAEESSTGSDSAGSDRAGKQPGMSHMTAPYGWPAPPGRFSKKTGYPMYGSVPPRPFPYPDFSVAHYPFAHVRGHGVPRAPMEFAGGAGYVGYGPSPHGRGMGRGAQEKEEDSSSSSASSGSSDSDEAAKRRKKRKLPAGHGQAPPPHPHYPMYHSRPAASPAHMPMMHMDYARGMGYPMHGMYPQYQPPQAGGAGPRQGKSSGSSDSSSGKKKQTVEARVRGSAEKDRSGG